MKQITALLMMTFAMLSVSACGDDDDDSSSETLLTVKIADNCEGVCSDIDLYIDGDRVWEGLDAGGSWSKEVQPDTEAEITAVSAENCNWTNDDGVPDVVPEEGLEKTLNCELPETIELTITLVETCRTICTEIVVTVDGEEAGTLNGEASLSIEVEEGEYLIEAVSRQGCIWEESVTVSKLGLKQQLTCEDPN